MPVQVAAPVQAPNPAPLPSKPFNVKFQGRATDVSGARVVYVDIEGSSLEISVGQVLRNGYLVSAIESASVSFVEPGTGGVVTLQLPPEPSQESR